MFGVGFFELIIVFVIVLVLFSPKDAKNILRTIIIWYRKIVLYLDKFKGNIYDFINEEEKDDLNDIVKTVNELTTKEKNEKKK